jgi:hypothetical protein
MQVPIRIVDHRLRHMSEMPDEILDGLGRETAGIVKDFS